MDSSDESPSARRNKIDRREGIARFNTCTIQMKKKRVPPQTPQTKQLSTFSDRIFASFASSAGTGHLSGYPFRRPSRDGRLWHGNEFAHRTPAWTIIVRCFHNGMVLCSVRIDPLADLSPLCPLDRDPRLLRLRRPNTVRVAFSDPKLRTLSSWFTSIDGERRGTQEMMEMMARDTRKKRARV